MVELSLDGYALMLYDNWLDIACVIILRSFCFKPKMVSDKKYPKEYFHNYISMLTSQGQKGESSYYLSKVLALGHKLILGNLLITL
jgi:hypothetical protein